MTEPDYELPVFPLEQPILPGQVVPLVLFEPRYLQLGNDLQQRSTPEFMIVGIDRGREVGGGEERSDVGVIARVLDLQQLPDGRVAMPAAGLRRGHVAAWLDDQPYPRAMVRDWPEDFVEDLNRHIEPVAAAVRALIAEAAKRMPDAVLAVPDLDPDHPDRTLWRLLASCGFGPLDTEQLLRISNPRQRAELAIELIDGQRELLSALGSEDG